jgi:hypothetical protein
MVTLMLSQLMEICALPVSGMLCPDYFAVAVIAILPKEASFVGDGSDAAIGVVGEGDDEAHRVVMGSGRIMFTMQRTGYNFM